MTLENVTLKDIIKDWVQDNELIVIQDNAIFLQDMQYYVFEILDNRLISIWPFQFEDLFVSDPKFFVKLKSFIHAALAYVKTWK